MTYDPDDFFDPEAELRRLAARPAESDAPPWLYVYEVDVEDDPWAYAHRMRTVLAAAIGIAAAESFDGDSVPVSGLPEWFVEVTSRQRAPAATAADFAFRGARRYAADQDAPGWDLQDWLYRFDPDSEDRAWRWWDITHAGGDRVRLWVDNGGEEFIASRDLRWLAFVCGAHIVHEPTLERPPAWAAEPSTGLPLKPDA
jgi:hypothetical protein